MNKHYRPEGYTEADQRSDTSFLVGVRYGREAEKALLDRKIEELHAQIRFLDFDIARLRAL